MHKGLSGYLDPGEASSISLAAEHTGRLLIIDELKDRKVARELRIAITGSLGILVTAKNKGLIAAVKPLIDKIFQTNFRLSDALIKYVLAQVDEL